ncbi:MAG: glycosyltransferase family 2 protein [Oscillospiraceae bacterium]|nr:glycosyltransferase family 2 protein [Oscillospiraceae bacterium]
MALISIVVPCYNEQEALPFFYKKTLQVAEDIKNKLGDEVEFIFVDDGSKDDTMQVIKQLAAEDARVRYVSFSRNFGKEAAMYAGLKAAKGDYISLMDADLQDPPELLVEMTQTLKLGEYDCVASRRTTRKGEPVIRSFFARMFYRLINRISKTDIVDGARDFRLMTRQMANAVLDMPEYNRFSKGIFGWVGFKTKWLEYINVERVAGETKWSFWKLFLYSLEGIVAFSTAPLALASVFGILMCVVAMGFIIFIIVRTLIWGDPTNGWPSMMCVIILIGGIQLLCIGILGQYMSKIYLETKHRPLYIIKEEK